MFTKDKQTFDLLITYIVHSYFLVLKIFPSLRAQILNILFSGIYKPYMELKEGTLIVIGNINPVEIVTKLKKKWRKANLTLFVPYDAREEAEMAEAKEKMEAIEREAFYRSNHEYRSLHIHTPHCNLVNDYEQGCVIC